jgi:hypothetical protein
VLQFGEPLVVLDRGTTRPVMCRLEGPTPSDSGEWVVKLPQERRPEALLAEAAAWEVLSWFGLRRLPVAVVRLPGGPTDDAGDWFNEGTASGRECQKSCVS